MTSAGFDFCLSIGGAAGQGIATPGNILARLFVRRGLHLNAYNAYQSIVRGGHIFLTMRIADREISSHGDHLNLLVCLNQDTMNRHLGLMGPGAAVFFNSDTITPGPAGEGVQLCPLPVTELSQNSRNKLVQNTISLGAITFMLGLDFDVLGDALTLQLQRKGQDTVDENVHAARAGYDHAAANFEAYPDAIPNGRAPQALWSGNEALAMGGAAAGVKFYCAYPMSPSTGVLHWMANNARDLDIMVRQAEDEIAVANMVIGAAPYRLPGHVRNLRRWLRPDDRSHRRCRDDGDPGRVHRRPARRPIDGRADEDGTGRFVAGARRQPGRFRTLYRRPTRRAGRVCDDSGAVQSVRQAPVSRHRPIRSADLRRDVQRRSQGDRHAANDRPGRTDHRGHAGRPLPALRGHGKRHRRRAPCRGWRATCTSSQPTSTTRTAC